MRTVQTVVTAAAVCLLSTFFCIFGAFDSYAYETVNALIPVICSEDSAEEQVYTIVLEAETAGAPMPESVSLELSNDETECFEIPLTEPGTYSYLVYELEGSEELIGYDTRVYGVTLFVEDNGDGALIYTVVANANNSAAKSGQIEFHNIAFGDKGRYTNIPSGTTTTTAEDTIAKTDTTAVETLTTSATMSAAATNNNSSNNTIYDYFSTVLTGDSFPAHTVRIIMLAATAAAVIAFLFKRRSSEEE